MFKAINKCINKIFETDQKLSVKDTTFIFVVYSIFLILSLIVLAILLSPLAS